jgi:hypothetical protein
MNARASTELPKRVRAAASYAPTRIEAAVDLVMRISGLSPSEDAALKAATVHLNLRAGRLGRVRGYGENLYTGGAKSRKWLLV